MFCRSSLAGQNKEELPEMKRSELLLSFDIEEFDLPEEYGASIADQDKFEISRLGTETILDVLDDTRAKATFFVTGRFAERYPELIIRMVNTGQEVASHGMDHSRFEVSHLKESKELLEKLSGKDVTGFRMARLAEVEKQQIKDAGFIYESSLNPVWLPGRYCNITAPCKPFKESCGLWQFPVSAIPVIRFPLFWLSFKNLPLPVYKLATVITLAMTHCYNMYSHPWEYAKESKEKRWNIPGYVVRHAGKQQAERLKELILFLKSKGEFITFQQYLAQREH